MEITWRGKGEGLHIFFRGEWTPLTEVSGVSESEGRHLCAWVARQFPGMTSSEGDKIPLPEIFLKPSFERERVCFYGGSFNPWHRGHLSCLELCPEKNILVVPDCNPWKSGRGEERSWNYCLELCHTLADTPYSVYPGLLTGEPSPTVDWLPQTGFARKSLLMGADNFLLLDRWSDCATLVRSLDKLYVAPRGESEYQKMSKCLKSLHPDLEIVILPRHPYEELASSGVRGS